MSTTIYSPPVSRESQSVRPVKAADAGQTLGGVIALRRGHATLKAAALFTGTRRALVQWVKYVCGNAGFHRPANAARLTSRPCTLRARGRA